MKEGKSSCPLWCKRVADSIHFQEGGVLASFEGHSEFTTRVHSVISSQLSNGDDQNICVTTPDKKRLACPCSGHKMYDERCIGFLMIAGMTVL